MRRAYRNWAPKDESAAIVARARGFCEAYAADGLDLTLRQLYYRFVAAGEIPNTEKSYKRLGSIVDDARMSGLLDWNHITDRTRTVQDQGDGWSTADQFAHQVLDNTFWMGRWRTQPTRVEVWVEKEAMAGIVGRSADRFGAPYFSCRGYVSQSAMWRAAQRIGRAWGRGQNVHILHLGDHDPSGLDMTRDIRDRLELFTKTDWSIRSGLLAPRPTLTVERIALNMDQVQEYDPPPNPAKVTDARFASYEAEFGDESWELDALEPHVLDDLITENIREHIDQDAWDAVEAEETEHRGVLSRVLENWSEIEAWLDDRE